MIAIDPPVRIFTFSLASKGPSTHAPTPRWLASLYANGARQTLVEASSMLGF
jgi:hypothetical protein